MRSILPFATLICLAFRVEGLPADESPGIDFAHQITPLLKQQCGACHTDGAAKGGLSLDTRADLLAAKIATPGKSAGSELLDRVTSTDPEYRMPREGDPLTQAQVTLLRQWIDAGLPWEDGFTFRSDRSRAPLAPRNPELPAAVAGRENPVDRFVDAYFHEQGIPRPGRLDDAAFLRRAHLDLIGLLPTLEELDRFLQDHRSDKRAALVQELLDRDRDYAEHWLTFWNDLLRNDYAGTGYIDGGRKQITGWLYQSLRTNKPYDEFVRELLNPAPDASGFIDGIKWRGRVNSSQTPEIQFSQNMAQIFLGINLKCASCHDSFIDDWKLSDAYNLAAIVSETPLEIHRCDNPTGDMAHAAFLFPELGRIDPQASRAERLQQLAVIATHPANGRLTRTIVNRLWERLFGRGIVHPVDTMDNPPWSPDLLDSLAYYMSEHGYDLKETLALIASSDAYGLESALLTEDPPGEDYQFVGPIARQMTAEQFVDALWTLTATIPQKADANVGDRGEHPIRASLVVSDPLMRSLGRPNREQVVTTRPAGLTTLQALDLSNGPMFAETLVQGARNLKERHPEWTTDQLMDWICRSALSRPPSPEELAIAGELVSSMDNEAGVADLLWSVLVLPEFQLIR